MYQVNAYSGRKTPTSQSSPPPFPGQRSIRQFAPQAPASSCAASASIVTPHVRQRNEWINAPHECADFHVPSTFIVPPNGPLRMVRYIADVFDRRFLSCVTEHKYYGDFGALHPHHQHQQQQQVPVLQTNLSSSSGFSGGKSGIAPSSVGAVVSDDLLTLFEDTMSELEVRAFYNPEASLDRVSSRVAPPPGCDAALYEHIRQYWLRKRATLEGRIALIPELRTAPSEGGEGSSSEVLGDCPLPFKSREWDVPVLRRLRGTGKAGGRRSSAKREDFQGFSKLVRSSQSMCYALLERERLRLLHSQMTVYELATLVKLSTDLSVAKSE